jgi:hypothetical protein
MRARDTAMMGDRPSSHDPVDSDLLGCGQYKAFKRSVLQQ